MPAPICFPQIIIKWPIFIPLSLSFYSYRLCRNLLGRDGSVWIVRQIWDISQRLVHEWTLLILFAASAWLCSIRQRRFKFYKWRRPIRTFGGMAKPFCFQYLMNKRFVLARPCYDRVCQQNPEWSQRCALPCKRSQLTLRGVCISFGYVSFGVSWSLIGQSRGANLTAIIIVCMAYRPMWILTWEPHFEELFV